MEISVETMSPYNTAIIIDNVNNVNKQLESIIDNIVEIIDNNFKFYPKVFFIDSHTKESKEVKLCGEHCIKRSDKEVNKKLQKYTDARIFEKNCKNAMFIPNFPTWFHRNLNIKNFIIMGYEIDEFARSLMSYICQHNIDMDVIVPENCVAFEDEDYRKVIISLMNKSGIRVCELVDS